MRLKAIEVINNNSRISSIDIFRALAILLVLFYHFNHLIPFGEIGVDLFFVISGFLVGGILLKQIFEGKRINFFSFFLKRGFKIWPSFYFFVIISFIINQKDFTGIAKYLFFYQNYTGETSHLWSLCVEEHFYIFLPIIFIVVLKFFGPVKNKMLFFSILLLILGGISFKFLSYYFTHSKDTFSATHNRIDALAWGVLLSWLIQKSKVWKPNYRIAVIGLVILSGSIYLSFNNAYFQMLLYHSFVPFAFFLMIYGLYAVDFSKWKWMRFIAYYSYNLYLWHVIFGGLILRNYGNSIGWLFVYLILSMLSAVVVTILIEEPFLKWRNKLLKPSSL